MKREETFKDILKPRNTHFGIVKFMTRSWSPRKCISNGLNYSSEEIKNAVSKSVFLDSIIEAESAKSGVCKEQLKKEIATYLDEIALDKKMHVVRWMGVFFLKMAFMMKIGIFVNEASVLKCCSCQLTGAMLISRSANSSAAALRKPCELQSTYKDIRRMLSNEFYHLQENEDRTFNKALEYCTQNQVVVASGTTFSDGTDQRLQDLLQWARAVKRVQELVEERGLHPYCLSLEAAGNCLQGLVMAGAAARRKICGRTDN
ncbi:unnamed protein product [Leptidea sinapis]|uniref:Uncharacterized protein n=1 Tax=Leptidea sinapis TaxID=189913 RepID=A0A5E4QB36_9NEOP|nr:unnamed protein product [Leptidea sinapis]